MIKEAKEKQRRLFETNATKKAEKDVLFYVVVGRERCKRVERK